MVQKNNQYINSMFPQCYKIIKSQEQLTNNHKTKSELYFNETMTLFSSSKSII